MRHRLSLLLIFVCSLMAVALTTPAVVAAQTDAWGGVCTDDRTATGVATIQGIQCLVGNILQVAVAGIGLAGFVMMIIGAFKYLLSGGNAKGIDEGQKTITYAVGGLILALSAYFILNIIADFTGVEALLNFRIPAPGTAAEQGP